MSQFVELLGNSVINGKGESVPVTELAGEGKFVCLYFSAHWCPPCRGFTPKFAEFYKKLKQTEKGKLLEVVFVSSDKDQSHFDEYFGTMPWHALPYSERNRKEEVSNKFKVKGIPTVVVLDGGNGQTITTNGRALVTEDPEGKEFPWKKRTFHEIMASGPPLVGKGGDTVSFDSLKGKSLAIYFSAHWCGPCRSFTPQLVKFYENNHEKLNFDLIFCSSDKDESSFKDYFSTMPWKAVPFGDKRKVELSRMYDVSGIPLLVIIDADGNLVTTNGRGGVSSDPEGKEFPWAPKPVEKLSSSTAGTVNERPCVIYFTEDDADVAKAKDAMQPIAEKEIAQAKSAGETPRLSFLTAVPDDDDDVVDSLMSFAKLGSNFPQLAIIDLDNSVVYISPEATIEAISKFVQDFLEKKLEGKGRALK